MVPVPAVCALSASADRSQAAIIAAIADQLGVMVGLVFMGKRTKRESRARSTEGRLRGCRLRKQRRGAGRTSIDGKKRNAPVRPQILRSPLQKPRRRPRHVNATYIFDS